jgi:hypothetical protein
MRRLAQDASDAPGRTIRKSEISAVSTGMLDPPIRRHLVWRGNAEIAVARHDPKVDAITEVVH